MPVSPDTISSTQKAFCLYLLYLATPPPSKITTKHPMTHELL